MMKLLLNALVAGFVWWYTYLWVRRFFNPDNKGNVDKWRTDALYGALASAISVIMKDIITKQLPTF